MDTNKNARKHQGMKFFSCLLLAGLLIFSSCVNVFAAEPYAGYNYTGEENDKKSSPNGYLPSRTVTGVDLGITQFLKPTDMFVDAHGDVYVLDAGNGRVVVMNQDFELVKVVDQFTYQGQPSPLNSPGGLYVTSDGEIYIADTGNHRVAVCNREGVIDREYGKPVDPLISETTTYSPSKIVVNANGDMYVLATNINNGALVITENGEFTGFFGAEKIQLTASQLADLWWRNLMTEDQIGATVQFVPVEYSNLYLKGDFIYTANAYEDLEQNQIRKLNPISTNVLEDNFYGDFFINYDRITGRIQNSSFVDVNEDHRGFIFCLDKNTGKVFSYSQEGDFLYAFGGTGTNLGEFKNPVSIETIGDKVLVLDDTKQSITVFEPTYFGLMVREGFYLLEHGRYDEALEPWNEVKKLNSNYEMAYYGIGRAYLYLDEYEKSMENFKLSYSRTGYSDAKKELRSEFLRDNFSIILTLFVLVCIALWLLSKNKKKIIKKLHIKTLEETGFAGMAKWKYPFYIMFHPYDGFMEMKHNKKGSVVIAGVIFVVWYLSAIIIRQYENFVFNPVNPDKINVVIIALGTVGIFLVGCLANWAICTLMDGKGTFKDIFIGASYSLLPSILISLVVTIISHGMIKDEAIFVQIAIGVFYAWTGLLIVMAAQVIHDFTFKKAVSMLLLTGLGMLIVLFLMLLVYTLFNQVVTFVRTIYYEIIYRFFAIQV